MDISLFSIRSEAATTVEYRGMGLSRFAYSQNDAALGYHRTIRMQGT